jgi:hypothetical protein
MTPDARGARYVAELEDRITVLEHRLARSRKVRDRLLQRLGRRTHPRPLPRLQREDDEDLNARGLY